MTQDFRFREPRTYVELGDGTKVAVSDVARRLTPEQLADLIANYVNPMGNMHTAKECAKGLEANHRTLQASTWRFLLEVLCAYEPDLNYGTDLRNEGAARAAQALREDVARDRVRYHVPFV